MKKLFVLLMAVLMLCCTAAYADTGLVIAGQQPGTSAGNALSTASNRYVIDGAGLYTADEYAEITALVDRLREEYQIDVVVLTTRLSSMSDYYLQDYADCYFDKNGYGARNNYTGVLFMIDIGNRYIHVSTSGDMIDWLTDSRVEHMLDACYDEIHGSSGYGSGTLAALNKLSRYMQDGREDGSFRYDAVTGRRISGIYNKLTTIEIILAIAGGVAVALIVYKSIASRYNLKNKTYAFNKSTQSSAVFYVNDARFIRETVRRIRHSSDSSGGGHGGSGGHRSGGSSVHHSSSGHSHGGGGRHF